MLVQGHATPATNGLHNDGGLIFTLGFSNSLRTRAAARVPAVYLKLAFRAFLAFLPFRKICKLRGINGPTGFEPLQVHQPYSFFFSGLLTLSSACTVGVPFAFS